MWVSSMSPCSMRRTTTAASSRSPRCLGNTLARLGTPTWCPARPTRCRPWATVAGDSTRTTRSTAPMSMPSSSVEVATTQRSVPVLRPSSMARRCSRDTEPWWALAISSPARSFKWVARRSARVRLLTKMIVERCAMTRASSCGYIAGQMERFGGAPSAGTAARHGLLGVGHVLDGDHHLDLQAPVAGGVDDGHRARAPLALLHRPPGQEAADGLQRALGGGEPDALGRDRGGLLEPLQGEREVGAPFGAGDGVDLVHDDPADRRQHLAGRRGEEQVQALRGGDEDVRRVAQHGPPLVGRGVAGAHGGRQGGDRHPEAGRGGGDAGERQAQVALDVVGEGLEGRDVEQAAALALGRGGASAKRRSRPHRKAARVLPEPVGAWISVCRPAAMAGHPCSWAAVGPGKEAREPLRHRPGEQVEHRHRRQATGSRPTSPRGTPAAWPQPAAVLPDCRLWTSASAWWRPTCASAAT